ncbi:NUDIX domain-containing protein [Leucobacter japonicus]|uniref:NUDIX domain-containing protein n=1 Tax=Leucobacter japonicus TaxID=1461259 RepID=UPI000A96670E|nr:NUDIX hydrolase [Leucobacter japonicus]
MSESFGTDVIGEAGRSGLLADSRADDVVVSASEVLAEGHVWDMRRDRFPFGGTELTRDYLDHTGAVSVLALDADDRVLLIKQYRHSTGHRLWEIPAGLMDVPGESGLTGARRELAEEADLQANSWHLLLDLFLAPGSSTEAMRVFLARDLTPIAHDYVRSEEEAELTPEWVPLDEVVAAVLDGRVQNTVTANAVLAAEAARARGWSTLRDPALPWNGRAAVRGERSR